MLNPIAADLDQMPADAAGDAGAGSVCAMPRACLPDGALFEVGPAYGAQGQVNVAAGLRTGHWPRHWSGAAGGDRRAGRERRMCWRCWRRWACRWRR